MTGAIPVYRKHMTEIQYIALSHVDKDDAKKDKRECNTEHSVYLKNMTFDEVADLLDLGSTIGRVGNKTDFIALDYDTTTVNIQTVIDKTKDNPDYRVSFSASNNPLKYHVLVNLHKTISVDDYKDVLEKEHRKLHDLVCGRCDVLELDKNAANFYQCFFGTSQESKSDIILNNSRRLWRWVKKDAEPKEYIEKESKLRPSMNSADFCKKHNCLTVVESKRFDVILPSMTHGRMKKIKEGHRYRWCMIFGSKILMRILYLNHEFNEGWTKWDFLDTFDWAVKTSVMKSDEFCESQDFKGVRRFFDNKWDILMDKSFEDQCSVLEPYFKSSKRQYKSRQLLPAVCSAIINSHLVDANTVVFNDKDELREICDLNYINYYRAVAFIKQLNYNVVFATVKRKRCCLDAYTVKDNTVEIPRAEVTPSIKKYCSIHQIKIIRV